MAIVRSVWTPVIKNLDVLSRTIKFVGTRETEDRTGDIIEVAGWELDNFVKNPVFLWNHDPGEGPIGRVTQIAREGSSLVFDVEFASRAVSEFADRVFKLYEAGFLKAVSVGFIPRAYEPIYKEAGGEFTGLRFTRQELLELSAVSIPAHQDALAASALSKAMEGREPREIKGYMTLGEFTKTALADIEPEANTEDDMTKEQGEEIVKQIEELKTQVAALTTLKETVELSKSAMATLNTLLVEKLGKGDAGPEGEASGEESMSDPTKASAELTKALAGLLARVQSGSGNFKPQGDK